MDFPAPFGPKIETISPLFTFTEQDEIISTTKSKPSKEIEIKEEANKGGLFQFLQANILSDTSS